jgi:hypothetical protein
MTVENPKTIETVSLVNISNVESVDDLGMTVMRSMTIPMGISFDLH